MANPTFPLASTHFQGLQNIIDVYGDPDNMLVAILNYLYSGGAPGSSGARTGMPELDSLDVSGHAAIAAAGGDIWLVGRSLLQGMAFDSLARTEGGASVTFYALKPGDSGITVQLTKGGGAAGLTYNTVTKALVIDIGAAGSTDDAVATLVNADASQCNGYVRATSAGGGSFTAAQAVAPMVGGTGDWAATKVMVGGLEALPANETGATTTAKWSDTGIQCTTQAVGAATDVIAVAVQSNARWTQQICGVAV